MSEQSLTLKFACRIDSEDASWISKSSGEGPRFHRWLPDGRNDAIKIDILEEDATVYLWFERCGFIDDKGFIEYELNRREVDSGTIARQGILYGGPLYGEIVLHNITKDTYQAVINNDFNCDLHRAFVKRLVMRLLDPVIQRFTRIIRDKYGQYWIGVPKGFDSRKCSIEHYLKTEFSIKWKSDDGGSGPVVDNNAPCGIAIAIKDPDFSQYLCESDWPSIGKLMQCGSEPSLANEIAVRAKRLLEEGKIRYALIETVVAIELAVEEAIREKLFTDEKLNKNFDAFRNTPLPSQLVVVSGFLQMNETQCAAAVRVIKERNRVVHEGQDPHASIEAEIEHALQLVASLLGYRWIKMPTDFSGNKLTRHPDDWSRPAASTSSSPTAKSGPSPPECPATR